MLHPPGSPPKLPGPQAGAQSPLHSFPGAAGTKYPKVGGFTQQEVSLSPFWRLNVPNQGVSRVMVSLKTLEVNLSHAFLLACGVTNQQSMELLGL